MLIHIVNRLENALGGSERAALALYEGLRARADVRLWSTAAPDPRLGEFPITQIGTDGQAPRGGTLAVIGNYFRLGAWLDAARPERLILNYNTVVGPSLKYTVIDRLRAIGRLEILYEAPIVRTSVAIPGPVFPSHVDLERFRPAAPPAHDAHADFVVGRLSRDTPEKHHPEDPALYRALADDGVTVRVMGGTCLGPELGAATGITLSPAGTMPAEAFLQGLDCFLYRTSENWTEAGGRVIFEALACGLPVVCHVNGGYTAWIEHGVNGFIFQTSAEAREIVTRLRGNAALRQRVGAAARASVERLFTGEGLRAYLDFFLDAPLPPAPRARPRVDLAWELGAGTGHVTTLLPVGLALKARDIDVRFLLRDPGAGLDLRGAAEIPREGAPVWTGPQRTRDMRTVGEILHNFGYANPAIVRQLIEAWRTRLAGSSAVIASAAPAAHIAARTLGIPSFEISEGFHVPPPTLPTPLLRDWLQVDPRELETLDREVLHAINSTLVAHHAAPIATLGELFTGRSVLLTYPELDIYPQRGPTEYFGVPEAGEGSLLPEWPAGKGPRVFAYLYAYYPMLEALLAALRRLDAPSLVLCRGIAPRLREAFAGSCVQITEEPMAVSPLLPQAGLVICHASHQMSAQALLAGKPLLLIPTQLEQFLKTRRIVSQGMGLGISADTARPDFTAALEELAVNPRYTAAAAAFAARYARHDRSAALRTMVERCIAAIG